MKNNKVIWTIVMVVVAVSIVVSFGTFDSHSKSQKSQPAPTPESRYANLNKYPAVDYEEPEPTNALEREQRKIKNKRYVVSLNVLKNPYPEITGVGGSDVETEPEPSNAIPFSESTLVLIGCVKESKAFLANEKKRIFSEFKIEIEQIIKTDSQRNLQAGEMVTVDRAGGVIRYASGQKILYQVDWQNMPEVNGRYVFFLITDDKKNPNYKILTAYRLQDGLVTALDNLSNVRALNGKSEKDFLLLVQGSK